MFDKVNSCKYPTRANACASVPDNTTYNCVFFEALILLQPNILCVV